MSIFVASKMCGAGESVETTETLHGVCQCSFIYLKVPVKLPIDYIKLPNALAIN